MECWVVGLSVSGTQETFFKSETELHLAGTSCMQCPANKEGGMWAQFAPTQGTSWIDQKGV